MSPPLSINAFAVSHGGRDIFRHVSCRIESQNRVALVGPSGSGKSLLLRAIVGLESHRGQLIAGAEEVTRDRMPRFRSTCIYLQQRPVFDHHTVRQNLQLPFTFAVNRDRQFCETEIGQHIERFGLSKSVLDSRANRLSGGESQLFALLRALQLNPSILLLDEATSAMDDNLQDKVFDFLRDWMVKNNNRAIVFVSHQASIVDKHATHIWQLSDGGFVDCSDYSQGTLISENAQISENANFSTSANDATGRSNG